tara:strand:+ start:148 stop:321 length:174 start_codon:yes stop_codon:yes gene_type:complete
MTNNNTTKENTMDIYCVFYGYFGELEIIEVFTDKARAEEMAAKMGSGYSVIESKLNS